MVQTENVGLESLDGFGIWPLTLVLTPFINRYHAETRVEAA